MAIGDRGYGHVKDRTFVLSPSSHAHGSGEVLHNREYDEEISSSTKTLDAQDAGKVFGVTVTSVITLAYASHGYWLRFVNCGSKDGEVQITISPQSINTIKGPDITPVGNKDIVNTLATAKVGDSLVLSCDGSSYWMRKVRGTWDYEGA